VYDAELFLNRELSWLNFNCRVLAEAKDKGTPLLERLRFCAIASSNLDEFFMIRVAGLKQRVENDIKTKDIAGLRASQQLKRIAEQAHRLVALQYRYLKQVSRELELDGIHQLQIDDLSPQEKEKLDAYFQSAIYPVLTPLAVNVTHPFPFLANRTLNLALLLSRAGEKEMALVQVPSVLPRILEVASSKAGMRSFIFLEDIIKFYCQKLFQGYKVNEIAEFRITRDADLLIDEEDARDLMEEMEKSLRQRRRGQAVRLEINKSAGNQLRRFLTGELKLQEADIYEFSGPLDLTFISKFIRTLDRSDLCYPSFEPYCLPECKDGNSLLASIRDKDIFLHHPYDSFEPVVVFIREAAEDPQVLAIKQTLYRVGADSPIVAALAKAAENGKQVTVLVELKARFDEENNIVWARRLEEAGCHVIYGLVGLKTHSKIALVVRQEDDGIRRYVHLGTGNYNEVTARQYTDMCIFTAREAFGEDASAFFNVLSGYSDPPVWNKFAVAPLGLREKIKALLDEEIGHAVDGRFAYVIAKMNSLLDPDIIMKLYEASQKGVHIDLIVRGICVLEPGIPGVSETIRVSSVIGRFLEHSRVFYFANNGDPKVYLSSADWMPRNLNDRVELMFPVDDTEHSMRIFKILKLILADNRKLHRMKRDGSYKKVIKKEPAIDSQQILLTKSICRLQKVQELPKIQPLIAKEPVDEGV